MAETVPIELRPALAEVLQQLVGGEFPDMLHWVGEYGSRGATLVQQPRAIWSHRWTSVTRTSDGGWHIVLPLWTTDESPSDLSAELVVEPSGAVQLHDVHVL